MNDSDPSTIPPLALRGCPRRTSYVAEGFGIHRRADLGEELVASLHAWQLLLTSGGCFTALTSAQVRGWWLPPIPSQSPIFLALGLDDPRPMRRGVVTSRHTRPIPFEPIDGLRCASVPETLLGCARWLSLIDLVVLLDCVLHRGEASTSEIEAVIKPRRPGAKALKRGLSWADHRAESPYESLLRLLHVMCGISVVPQSELHDANGTFVARLDLHVAGTNAAHEYDGVEHEELPRRVQDRRRDRAIESAGHVRRGYTSGDVLHRAVRIVADADRSLGRSHEPARVRPWLAELRHSLFTPSGQTEFLARLPENRGGRHDRGTGKQQDAPRE